MMSRESPSGPPPLRLWKLTRASGIAARVGASDRSHSELFILRDFLRTMLMLPLPTLARSNTRSTSGLRAMRAATRSVTASVSLSVLPGAKRILARE